MDTLNTDKNIIQFADGDVVYIEDVKYSHNGITHWEDNFNPNEHLSTLDGVTEIGPHRYKKVKHSGDTEYQLPMKIIPDEIIFSKDDNKIYWKYEYNSEWNELIDLINLTGPKGDRGDNGKDGEGLQVDYVGYYYDMPSCNNSLSSDCNQCNPSAGTTINKPVTYLSVGDGAYKITSTDITNGNVSLGGSTYTHFSNDASNWVSISAALANQEVQYLAEDNSGLNAINLKNTDYQGSSGTVYVCVNNGWSALSSLEVKNPTVKLNSGAVTGKYLEDFINGTYIDIQNEYFTITNNSIDPSKVNLAEFTGNGIQVDGTQFAVKVDDITDVNTGIAYDGTNLYVNSDDLNDYGLGTIDGTSYTNKHLYVKANDITGEGLTSTLNAGSTYEYSIDVNDGDGIAINGSNEVVANVDGATINTNVSGELQVSEISGIHINDNIAGNALVMDTNTPYPLHVKADESTITVDGSNDYIKVADYGITNTQLGLNSVKDVNLDEIPEANFYIGQGTSTDVANYPITGDISINSSGVATVIDGSNDFVTEDHLKNLLSGDNGDILLSDGSAGFTWSTTTITEIDNHIANTSNPHSITHSDVGSDVAQWNANQINSVTVAGSPSNDEIMIYNSSTGDIEWQTISDSTIGSINELDDVNASSATNGQVLVYTDGTFNPDDANAHEHSVNDITDIDGTFVKKDNLYSNIKITSDGLVFSNGYKLIVDSNGNLDTTTV